jgi:hypothetical protein
VGGGCEVQKAGFGVYLINQLGLLTGKKKEQGKRIKKDPPPNPIGGIISCITGALSGR